MSGNQKKIKLSDAFKPHKNLLLLVGFYPKNLTKPDKLYPLRSFFGWFMTLLIFIPMLIESFSNFNYSHISNAMFYFITQICYICKLVNFIFNHGKLRILEEFLESAIFNQHTTPEENGFIKTVVKTVKVMSYVFRCGIFALCVSDFIFPQLEAENALVLPGWYPVNKTKYRTEIITTQVLSVGFSAHYNSTLDLLNYAFIMLGSAQLEILMGNLVRVYDFEEDVNEEERKEVIFKRICSCVEHHQKIIEYVDIINQTFSNGLFIQFIATLLVVCLTGFKMVVATPSKIELLAVSAFLFCILFQISMYCYCGNELMFKSLLVGDACYMSMWYENAETIQKVKFIIMERAKIPLILTGGKFFNLTLASFVLLMRSSYSYFAVLQRVYNQTQ